jgi:diguanylate cyclase (GGDEF)-like protein
MAEPDAETRASIRQDTDQSAADLDQTQADSDQAASEDDQDASDTDQALADREQHAADRDQAASDWERGHAGEAEAADEARDVSRLDRAEASRRRGSTTAVRTSTTAQRLATAQQRDEVARIRDRNATARDRAAADLERAADARDRAGEARESLAAEAGIIDPAVAALKALRASGAALRLRAARDRTVAAADRAAAAADRENAAADREDAGLDALTGIFRRGPGEYALDYEVNRSRRLSEPMTLGIIDVDALKAVNEEQGRSAGDALLREVARAIASTTRSYDVTVRWGGDEFVCALLDTTIEVASRRIRSIQEVLGAFGSGGSVTFGLVELRGDDTLVSLIDRAGADLARAKAARA